MNISSRLFAYDNAFQSGQMILPMGEILQIAELSIIKGGDIGGHTQWCDEITYAVSGKATVYSGDKTIEMSAGQVHFMKKGDYHNIIADENTNFHYYCIGFTLNPQSDEVSVFARAVESLKDFLVEDEGNIKMLFSRLLNEFYIRDEESNIMINSYFCQILIILYRILSGKSKQKLNRINTSVSNHAVYNTLRYIDREYLKITEVKQIAAELSYSEYYLSHIFKEKMGITVKDYLMQKKIMSATEMLKTDSMSISDIAEQLCFSSLHSFGVAFKRYTDMSPSEFRRQAKEN